jgi:hypothetical protein
MASSESQVREQPVVESYIYPIPLLEH